jgi:hypothetical protein
VHQPWRSGLTLAFQRRTAENSHKFTRSESLRQERLDVYCVYAGALLNYRRCPVHLWFCLHEQPPHEDPDQVRVRAYDLRSAAQEAHFRVRMLTDDDTLGRAAEEVLDAVANLHKTDSRSELDERRERTREGINDLVSIAKRHVSGVDVVGLQLSARIGAC